MKKVAICALLCTEIFLFGCKQTSTNVKDFEQTKSSIKNIDERDPLDTIEDAQQKDLENAYFYVLAPNGLSLRKSDNTNSERLFTIPFGSKVKQVSPVYTIDITVENIEGSMMEIIYRDKMGYAFSGFLSPFPLPNKEEGTKDYISRLQTINPKILFEETDTDADFHDGIVQKITFPNTQWHEAFYIAKAIYGIPKSFLFPGRKGLKKESVEQVDKEDYVWSSDLFISRNTKRLDSIQYSWRAEGSGYIVLLTEPKEGQLKIEYTGYVD